MQEGTEVPRKGCRGRGIGAGELRISRGSEVTRMLCSQDSGSCASSAAAGLAGPTRIQLTWRETLNASSFPSAFARRVSHLYHRSPWGLCGGQGRLVSPDGAGAWMPRWVGAGCSDEPCDFGGLSFPRLIAFVRGQPRGAGQSIHHALRAPRGVNTPKSHLLGLQSVPTSQHISA